MQQLGSILYQGKQREIWLDEKQRRDFDFRGGKIWVNQYTAENQMHFLDVYDQFCKNELEKIIHRQLNRLRSKPIPVEIEYQNTQTKERFFKEEAYSVDEFLRKLDFSPKIEYQIGKYEREWGVNQISPQDKRFTLLFNLDLIKFDGDSHIEYVVAHELAHVFHRDHGDKFQKALQNLYSGKNRSEYFFEFGIKNLVSKPQTTAPLVFVLGLIGLAVIYWIYAWLAGLNSSLNGFLSSPPRF
jgi:predicted metal-dependent hydrolase